MDIKAYEFKLKKVLEKFSVPQYVITDNYNVDNLLSHLSGKNDSVLGEKLLKVPLLSDWLTGMLADQTKFEYSHTCSVKIFVLRLMAVVIENEVQYTKLFYSNVFDTMKKSVSSEKRNPSVQLAYINVLHGFMKYPSGINWLLEKRSWMCVLRIYKKLSSTLYLRTAAINFLVPFVWKLCDLEDERNLSIILEEVIKPLLDNPWKGAKVINNDQNEEMDRVLTPTIRLIIEIVSFPKHFHKDNLIMQILYVRCSLDINMWDLYFTLLGENVLRYYARLAFITIFVRAAIGRVRETEVTNDDFMIFNISLCNLVRALIDKGDLNVIVDMCFYGYHYMSKFGNNMPYTAEDGKGLNIRNQLVMLSIVPIISSCKSKKEFDQEIVQQYIMKLFSMSCEQMTRIYYMFRQSIKDKELGDRFTTNAIIKIIGMKDVLSTTQANIAFQALYYRLHAFMSAAHLLDTPAENIWSDHVISGEAMTLLSTLLDGIYCLVEKFDISWHESVEIINIYNTAVNILIVRNIHNSVVVKALKLIKLTINKFLPPNLALLVDSKGTAVGEIGANIYAKLHDPNWDVRDSALELLLVIAEIALIKYPSFQKQILDENLGSVTMALAINDSESYVRATALRCLGTMFRIPALWEQCMELQPDLPVKVIKMLDNETEGIIRKEAAAVLNGIYEHQKFPDHLQYYLLHTMVHAATEDLHWEVQLAALQFWKTYINKQLSNQGMLDGRFPSVTFSKEHRKIVTLDDKEIRKRLSKVLKDLSVKGCLSVMLRCLTTEYDVDVLEFNYGIVKNLHALLQQYDVRLEADPDPLLTSNGASPLLSDIKNEVVQQTYDEGMVQQTQIDRQKSDMVIESILNADDINLLACVYENQLNINQRDRHSEPDVPVVQDIQIEKVDPAHFISQISNTDYEKLITAKKLWLSGSTSFHSLLDDILGEYHPSEVNDMDCY